ncbi:MAG: hypothetical protein CMJ05_10765 [Pelagibacterales bacterium]|nr:hypothetical protein [Pelagibacterales bacterium]|tara:strand:+ start:1303 stop:2391 length:1089 start_codon:yes stop_codon:yes gene_type:complete
MRFTQLDGLRGISSLMIIFYHFEKIYTPEMFYNFFFIRQGQIFVDVFFIMSGFVIYYHYNTINSNYDFLKFIKKRFFRLYPLLFTTSVFFLIFYFFRDYLFNNGYSHLFNFNTSQLSNDLWDFLESILLTNSNLLLGNSIGVNSPSWSISAEIICYFIFGILTIYNKRPTVKVGLIIISSFFLISFSDTYFATRDFGFLRGIIGFNYGAILCWIYNNYNSKIINSKISQSYLFLILTTIGFMIWMNLLNLKLINTELMILLTPIIISVLVFSIIIFQKKLFLNNPIFQFFGNISYSIYLNHLFIVIYFPKFAELLNINLQNTINQLILMLLIIILTVLISYFTYNWIEKYFYPSINKTQSKD